MSRIIEKLKKESKPPWSFSEYMEVALYDSDIGYYTNKRKKLGKEGDFYTSNHVHPVFAKTFSRFFLDVIKTENMKPTICEWGAGDGSFAYHVLCYIESESPDLFQTITYYIIESSPHHQALLTDKLGRYKEKIKVFASLEEMKNDLSHFEGIIFSNELLDAFPVHIIEKTKDAFKEVMIEEVDQTLVEKLVLCDNHEIIDWMNQFGPPLPDGHRIEINLQMKDWLKEVASWLTKGMVVSVDYGYSNDDYQRPERKEGSIRGYRNHEMIKDPLQYPGDMDLTSHVQWDAYDQIAKNVGLTQVLFDRQDQFLLKAGLFSFLVTPKDMNPFSEEFKLNRAIQSFVHPSGISTSFQVNVHGKELRNKDNYQLFHEDPYQIKKP
ncbi:class I SAM-dependent methyltransferase [Salipaludibacillus daqingensis]|uniref:class I SAM-dependent methyltransferase n=1 Tax=Salipaludibacillus daqingensis TaxID=3041001 RepID=UPI0024746C93|nr:SAM-dependent methyltransferase [Salipaludibacillus daqingensis]